ncbi:MAG: 2-methylfumaryl-CoA isomerase [Alphaproteobacteria bacterium]|nr:2-methylfumaryl-CoA isomerase [Alphaproteobacteria bacterium]
MTGILSDLRVFEGSAFVAAPLAGMWLSQLGAEVIRFDPIGGGLDRHRWPVTAKGDSLYWASLNKGKRSIAVDIRKPEGRDLIQNLIAAHGLFVTNFPAEGWLSYEELKRKREDLVMAAIRGQPDGATAVDYTVNAAAGFPLATGPEGSEEPINHVLPAWDIITGLSAAFGLLAAERHRRLTGKGQLVRLSLMDSALAMLGHLGILAEVEINGVDRPRVGNDLYGAFGRDFATADGQRVMIVALTERQWRAAVESCGIAEDVAAIEARSGLDFRKEGDRFEARETLNRLVEDWVAKQPYAEVARVFGEKGVLFERYQSFAELVRNDPRCGLANPLFGTVDQPGIGRMLTPGALLDFSAEARLAPVRAPLLGEHTDEILSGVLGLSSGEIGGLHDRQIVAGSA